MFTAPTCADLIFKPILLEKMTVPPNSDVLYLEICLHLIEDVALPFGENKNGLLCRKVPTGKILISRAFKIRVQQKHRYIQVAGHPGRRKPHQSILKAKWRSLLAADWYSTIRRSQTCAIHCIQLRHSDQKIQLHPATALLKSAAYNVVEKLAKKSRGNHYLLVISDRFNKLTK